MWWIIFKINSTLFWLSLYAKSGQNMFIVAKVMMAKPDANADVSF